MNMNAVLQAKERKEFRRSELRKLRKEGQIPGLFMDLSPIINRFI